MDAQTSIPRISIRGLLVLTFIVALAALPLAKPWSGWLIAFPPLASILVVYVVAKFVTSSVRARVFWAGFLVGAFVFLIALMLVGNERDLFTGRRSIWDEVVCEPAWRLMHGDAAFRSNPGGITTHDYHSFKLFVVVDAAMLVSAAAALAAQLLVRRQPKAA